MRFFTSPLFLSIFTGFLLFSFSAPVPAQDLGRLRELIAEDEARKESPNVTRPSLSLNASIVYNEEVPPLVTDTDLLKALKLHTSQWVQQTLVWPSDLERRIHSGISSYDQRAGMIAWLDAAFKFRPMPPELLLNAVEMRNWLVLYSDWKQELGADAFVMRFTNKGYAIHINESETNIVMAVRPERATDLAGLSGQELALTIADDLLREYILPADPASVLTQKIATFPTAVEGTWQPSGTGSPRRSLASEMPPLAVRYFAAGQFVAFNINKLVWKLGENPTLFADRFQPPANQDAELDVLNAMQNEMMENPRLADPAERIIFYQRLQRQLNIKTVEEFLGPMLYDSMGERITSRKLDYRRIMGSVEELNQDQRNLLLRQRQIDAYYLAGLKAFEQNDLEMAIDQWSRALALDPTNVRVSVLLQVSLEIKIERDFGGNTEQARRDRVVDNIRELLAYHRQTVMKASVAEDETVRRERDVYELRAKGIELYREGLYAESAAIWRKVLKLDPGNATASLWLATLEGKKYEKGIGGEVALPDSLKRALQEDGAATQ